MKYRWPEGTQFKLKLNGEERIETLDAPQSSSENRVSSRSPLGKALHAWLSNPGPKVIFQAIIKNSPVLREAEMLQFRLPGGEWVENRPELWEFIRLTREEELFLKKWNSIQRSIERVYSRQFLDKFLEKVVPELACKRYLNLLNRGEYWWAPKIAALLRDELNKPWECYRFVKEWKDRIPHGKKDDLRVLLTVGIGAINDLWNGGRTSDKNLLEEALSWGKEALAIKEDAYTYCALQVVCRALNRDDWANRCLEKAKKLDKPCKIKRLSVRRSDERAEGEFPF